MKNITVCLTYFRSLALANLEAALYSVKYQDMSRVNCINIIDNNTDDSIKDIQRVIDHVNFDVPVGFSSFKHKDKTKTHAWSCNTAVERTQTSWIFFTRADYILDWGAIDLFQREAAGKPEEWDGFITSEGMHLHGDIAAVNATNWRHVDEFPRHLAGTPICYTKIDTGVWMMPTKTFRAVGGLDERLTAWGHAQTHFQHKLYLAGVEFVVVPKTLFFHPLHAGERNLDLAHQQIADIGVDLRGMWARHTEKMY